MHSKDIHDPDRLLFSQRSSIKSQKRPRKRRTIQKKSIADEMRKTSANERGANKKTGEETGEEEYPKTTSDGLKKLQNGSDVRGVASAGVRDEPVTITAVAVFSLAAAFVDFLREKKKGDEETTIEIGIGRDPRISGERLKDAFAKGVQFKKAKAIDCELSTTPACFFATLKDREIGPGYDGCVMLTASHLPFNRNGIKFFTANGGLDKSDVKYLCERAGEYIKEAEENIENEEFGMCQTQSYLDKYASILRDKIIEGINDGTNEPLKGFKIVVDAGNGSGGFFATKVLEPLGADCSGSQFLEPDGMFPNHAPNPEEKEAMESATKAVLKAKADLGIVFDTDVDRSAVIDSFGKEINRNKLIAVLSHIALQKEPGSTIVTDSVTSSGLKSFIENLGGKHLRYMRGYKNVINKGMELNKEGINAPLMIETSGHGAMKENYNLDDGAYLAVKIIIEAVKRKNAGGSGIGEILKNLKEPLESIECRLKISNAEFKKVGSEVIEKFTAAIDQGYFEPGFVSAKENFEGIRAESQGKGWFLLRSSLHDPVMVLNIESDEKGGVSNYAKQIDKWFSENRFEDVDYSSIATKI